MSKKPSLASQLQKLIKGLILPSEMDSSMDVVEFPGGENDYANPNLFRKLAKVPSRTKMVSRSGLGFFDSYAREQESDSAAIRKLRAKFKSLAEFYDSELADIVVHRCGTNKITLYVIGRTSSGDALGITATQVET